MSEVPLPEIRRARDFHLYTGDGRRLLDLYLDGGAALLGHRPALLGRELKSVLGRGLLGNLPSVHGARLVRVLHR
ncbi:MAG: class III aminotransferase, partial [Spirochaetaceae bacterium]|nr:class III aminotransferase [Spirochaetaceae bacterium]